MEYSEEMLRNLGKEIHKQLLKKYIEQSALGAYMSLAGWMEGKDLVSEFIEQAAEKLNKNWVEYLDTHKEEVKALLTK